MEYKNILLNHNSIVCLNIVWHFLRIVCWQLWSITIVGDSMNKQFSTEKGAKMSALPAMVGGLSVNIPVGTV